jgi:uncharacterized membrane protein
MYWESGLGTIAGLIVVYFIPGFLWSYVFFRPSMERRRDDFHMDLVERMVLSLALSITFLPLTIFALNEMFNIDFSVPVVLAIIIGLCILGIMAHYVRFRDLPPPMTIGFWRGLLRHQWFIKE